MVSIVEDAETCLGRCACIGESPGLQFLKMLASRLSGSAYAAELEHNTDALQSGLIAAQAIARDQMYV